MEPRGANYPRLILAKLLLLVTLAAGTALGPVANVAGAQEPGTAAVVGTLEHDGAPVADVEILVRRGGDEVGRARSDERGRFLVAVPGAGTYEVSLVESTLPPGVELARGARATLDRVVVQDGAAKRVLFRLGGAAGPPPRSEAARLATLAIAGIRFGLIVAVASVGLTLVFGTTGIINLAHGELVTFGALVAWYVSSLGVPLVGAALVAAAAGAVFGRALEATLWRGLRHRGTDLTTVMVITIGLSLLLRNVYLVVFEGPSRAYADHAAQRPWIVGSVRILPKSVAIVVLAVVVLVLTGWFLRRTRAGTAMRAVGDQPRLAAASGIDADVAIRHTWMLGSALAAIGGVMLGATEGVQWDMGLRLLLLMAAAVVVGGLGNVYGALVGGLLVGCVSELSTYWLPSDLKLVLALAVLIGALLLRPTGLFGRAERIG